MSQEVLHRCKKAECTVATTGKCVEGLDLSTCPYYLGTEAMSADAQPAAAEESVELEAEGDRQDEAEMVDLPDGLDFTPESATQITRAGLTRVIVIAGDQDSGKTTLISSVFDKFQEGPFAGYLFAGCRTFRGLERRCFPSRIVSERMHADTTRTPRGDGQLLLHLQLRAEDLSRPPQDLLLTDISGEFFRDACDSTEGCLHLGVLRRADHLALCLDGEKLASNSLKHEAFNTGKLLLQSTLDADMVGQRTFVDVLITKRDLLGPAQDSSAQIYLDHIRERLTSDFEHRVGRLRFFEVAARPESSGFPLAYGLDQVLSTWVEDTPFYTRPRLTDIRDVAGHLVKTEFDRYLMRQPVGRSTGR